MGFSLFARILHEGKVAIRHLFREGKKCSEITSRLQELTRSSTKEVGKYSVIILVIAITLKHFPEDSVVFWNTPYASVSLPKLYLISAGIIAVYMLLYYLLPTLIYICLSSHLHSRSKSTTRFSNFKNKILGDDYADVYSPIRTTQLLTFNHTDKFVLTALYVLPLALSLFPILAATSVIYFELFKLLENGGFDRLDAVIAYSAFVIGCSSLMYAIIFFVPFRVRKDLQQIRWGFLYPINANSLGLHPSLDHWLQR